MKILRRNSSALPIPEGKLKWSVWNDHIDVSTGDVVIFNTLHRSAIVLSSNEVGIEIDKLSDTQRNELCKMGILCDAGCDEKKEWEQRFFEAKNDMEYLDLTILLTENCQMQCIYCFEGSKHKKNISSKTIEGVISFLEQHKHSCKKLRILWFGGEPLLAYESLRKISEPIIAFCREYGIDYSADMTSNGYALTPTRCDELVNKLQVKRYIITIDGPEEIHEQRRPLSSRKPSFKTIMRNIELLTDAGAWVTIRVTVDKQNAPYVPALLDYIANSKLYRRVGLAFPRTVDINYTPAAISDTFYSEEEYADVEWELINYAHKLNMRAFDFPYPAPDGGCLRNGDIVIGVDGQIYKCLDTVGNECWVSGSINGNDTPEPEWSQVWNQWSPLNSVKCCNCVLLPLCNGGCPHNALFEDKKHGSELSCPDWVANYKRQIAALCTENHECETI